MFCMIRYRTSWGASKLTKFVITKLFLSSIILPRFVLFSKEIFNIIF